MLGLLALKSYPCPAGPCASAALEEPALTCAAVRTGLVFRALPGLTPVLLRLLFPLPVPAGANANSCAQPCAMRREAKGQPQCTGEPRAYDAFVECLFASSGDGQRRRPEASLRERPEFIHTQREDTFPSS